MNESDTKAQPALETPEAAQPEVSALPKIRKITIKTAVRAAGQSHNRFSAPTSD